MEIGIYEALITQLLRDELERSDPDRLFIHTAAIDKEEAAGMLARHIAEKVRSALGLVKGDDKIAHQIEIANKIILLLRKELNNEGIKGEMVHADGQILTAVLDKQGTDVADLNKYVKEITPYTRLSQSELFTGGNMGLSLESELKKEILSADEVDLLVSFIKFKGVIILEPELRAFTNRGGRLRVMTTTYMGASDYKAIQLLANLKNTEVKVSYNTGNERLHAKAYLFRRRSGFHTGYIGSSNFSRSALTDGLEWNLKVTTKEVGHIIDKFRKTFDSYWHSDDFELFSDAVHKEKLIGALRQGQKGGIFTERRTFFDIKPYPFQAEILEKLEVERKVHLRHRNLIVAATGTGKTVISAFDYKRFKDEQDSARLLFIAHRKEILEQAADTFRGIVRDNNFGELWVDGLTPATFECVFASVQTLNNRLSGIHLSRDYYDYIVIDECHHLTASSYRGILEYFTPKVLLGLTATPERMDGGDIKEDFHDRIAAEIRLPEALNRKLLCPFQYFGVTDSIDLAKVGWERGRYVASELTSLYTANDRRVREILDALEQYTRDPHEVRALGFCVDIEHAKYMADKFTYAGFRADYLTSANSQNRAELRQKLLSKTINYLFVVDIFNEGVDIPEIDTVLFLRPTESLTIFLQQLGRGLRLAENKDCLTVLDFVGNSRPEYNFENKFRALIGKTSTPVLKEVEDNFPHLPLGCSIILERKARAFILANIAQATALNRSQLLQKIKHFENHSTAPFSLRHFIDHYNIPLQYIYKLGGWKKACFDAGRLAGYDDRYEKEIVAAIYRKWLSTRSTSYFTFILELAKRDFQVDSSALSEAERAMLLMLHVDIWQKPGAFATLEDSIRAIGSSKHLVAEIVEVLEILLDRIDFKEFEPTLPYQQPLKVHARYTRDQILAAFGLSTFNQKSSNREGVAANHVLNTELLFINLIKSEEHFSPTTLYDDYAISETQFHWQSQNAAGPDTPKGESYINHRQRNKNILLFIREKNKDEYGNTMGFVFVGQGNLLTHSGSKPMNIVWELTHPLPPFLWHDAAKLQAG